MYASRDSSSACCTLNATMLASVADVVDGVEKQMLSVRVGDEVVQALVKMPLSVPTSASAPASVSLMSVIDGVVAKVMARCRRDSTDESRSP